MEDVEEKRKKCKGIRVQEWEEKTHPQGVSDERRSVAPVRSGIFVWLRSQPLRVGLICAVRPALELS